MTERIQNPKLNWDRLLDGGTYVLNLNVIGWQRGVTDLRAKVRYEADRRRGLVRTTKLSHLELQVQGQDCRVRPPAGPCTCEAPFWDFHLVTCKIHGEDATAVIGGPPPSSRPSVQYGWAPHTQDSTAVPLAVVRAAPAAPGASLPAPVDQPPSDTDSEPTEAEIEALLGPCTCGQSPSCTPQCSRVAGT